MARRTVQPPQQPTSNGNGRPDDLRRFEEIVGNVLMIRREMFAQLMDPRRNVEDECGYPRLTETVNPEVYQQLYDRDAVAARVVEVLPKESWQVQPLVYEVEDAERRTAFEQAWDELGKGLRGESFYQDERGSPVWEYLLRADVLSGIGLFGLVLLGIDDGKDMSLPAFEPAYLGGQQAPLLPRGTEAQYFQQFQTAGPSRPPAPSRAGQRRRLLFIRVFPESLVEVTQSEADPFSPRFGQPVMYLVTFNDPRAQATGVGLAPTTLNVHWTRAVHVADNLQSSEVYGVPRMRPVLNNLLGLHKLYAGAPEMYWRGAFPGLSMETHPQLGGDVEVDKAAVRDQLEQYMNGLQRYLALTGMSAKTLSPQVVDPTQQINTQIEAIAIQLGIPIRVFKGSERGELASSQDDAAWNDRLRQRQQSYLTPRLIVPFVDRLIQLGVLPRPKGYSVYWPDLTSQSEQEKAAVAVARTQALAAYVSGSVEALVPPLDYLTRILGFDEEEAAAILENAAEAVEEKMAEQEAQAEDAKAQGFEPAPPEGFQKPGVPADAEPTPPVMSEGEVVEEEGEGQA